MFPFACERALSLLLWLLDDDYREVGFRELPPSHWSRTTNRRMSALSLAAPGVTPVKVGSTRASLAPRIRRGCVRPIERLAPLILRDSCHGHPTRVQPTTTTTATHHRRPGETKYRASACRALHFRTFSPMRQCRRSPQ